VETHAATPHDTAAKFDAGFWAQVLWRMLPRPTLWGTAIRQGVRLIPRDWWKQRPYLPIPDPRYLQFRTVTNYGSTGKPNPQDVVTYLEWVKDA
jgi:hypothetical protein